MANLFQRLTEGAGDWMAQRIAAYIQTPREQALKSLQGYYEGNHPQQLRVKSGQDNDNITINFIGLTIDRAVSMLIGAGVEFEYSEENETQDEYIDRVWDANKRAIFLHDTALDGATWGTPFVKIIPDGMTDPYTGEVFPRFILLDPKLMTVDVDPLDKSKVMQYIMQYKITIEGKERVFREVTRRALLEDGTDSETWIIETLEFVNGWRLLDKVEFPYDFPPIIHWKNLPSIHSVYGMSDIEQVIPVQDKYNFVFSNNLKINRYHAHPKTWGAGVTKTDKSSWGADEMILISSPDGKINNLEMQSDLGASRTIAQDLRQSIFDVSRQLDVSSLSDKVGQLTNFGLRVLYSDAIAKTKTKQELYGEAFAEMNRRLLIMAGLTPVKCEVVFGNNMPISEKEELEIDAKALDMGIVDKQTVAEKWSKRYGQDWDTLSERMAEQKANESNIGTVLLQRFNRGE